MPVSIVALSFFENTGKSAGVQALGFVVVAGMAMAAGSGHGILIRRLKMPAIIVTVVTYIGFQGVALLLRSTPGGLVDGGLVTAAEWSLGPVPVVFIVAAALAVGAELVLRRTRWGIALRAIGSNEESAFRNGVKADRVVMAAYVLCSLLAAVASILLLVQVGSGNPTAGFNDSLVLVRQHHRSGAGWREHLRGPRILHRSGPRRSAADRDHQCRPVPQPEPGQSWQNWFPGILIIVAGGLFAKRSSLQIA